MMRNYYDSVAITLPRTAAIESPMLPAALTLMAEERLHVDYPKARMVAASWVFCLSVADIEAWVPACGCDDCLECKTKGILLMEGNPNIIVALGTLYVFGPYNRGEGETR